MLTYEETEVYKRQAGSNPPLSDCVIKVFIAGLTTVEKEELLLDLIKKNKSDYDDITELQSELAYLETQIEAEAKNE